MAEQESDPEQELRKVLVAELGAGASSFTDADIQLLVRLGFKTAKDFSDAMQAGTGDELRKLGLPYARWCNLYAHFVKPDAGSKRDQLPGIDLLTLLSGNKPIQQPAVMNPYMPPKEQNKDPQFSAPSLAELVRLSQQAEVRTAQELAQLQSQIVDRHYLDQQARRNAPPQRAGNPRPQPMPCYYQPARAALQATGDVKPRDSYLPPDRPSPDTAIGSRGASRA